MAKQFKVGTLVLNQQSITADSSGIYLNGAPISGQSSPSISNGVTGISITGSSSLTGLVSFSGAGTVTTQRNGDIILISGAASSNITTDSSGNLYASGVFAPDFSDSVNGLNILPIAKLNALNFFSYM